MKTKIITVILQTIANITALWFVFVNQKNWFVSLLLKIGIEDTRAHLGILGSLALFISSMVVILGEWLIFSIIFKPIILTLSFRNGGGGASIKNLAVEYSEASMLNSKKSYSVYIEVSGGNWFTNRLISFLKSDIVISYNPDEYDTELKNGYISTEMGEFSKVYRSRKDKNRIYWSDIVKGANVIESPLIRLSEFVIVPKSFENIISQAEIRVGSHSKTNIFSRIIFKFVNLFLIQSKSKKLSIKLKKVGK